MTAITTPHSFCRLGYRAEGITPPVGIYHRMWGAATHEQSTGVHRDLEAAVLTFAPMSDTSGLPALVLIALDHCLFWPPEMLRLKQTIQQRTGIPERQIVITFSHTHGAGLMDPSRKKLPGGQLIEPYLDSLAKTVVRLIYEALDDRR